MFLNSGGAALQCTGCVKQIVVLQRNNVVRDHSVADASMMFRAPEAVKARFRDGARVVGLVSEFCSSPGGSWREDVQRRFFAGLSIIFAGFLATVCHLGRSCPRLVLSFCRVPFGTLTRRGRNRNKVQGTFTENPSRSRPCWAYSTTSRRVVFFEVDESLAATE